MDLEDVMPSEVSQTEKDEYHTIPFIRGQAQRSQIRGDREPTDGRRRGGGRGMGEKGAGEERYKPPVTELISHGDAACGTGDTVNHAVITVTVTHCNNGDRCLLDSVWRLHRNVYK